MAKCLNCGENVTDVRMAPLHLENFCTIPGRRTHDKATLDTQAGRDAYDDLMAHLDTEHGTWPHELGDGNDLPPEMLEVGLLAWMALTDQEKDLAISGDEHGGWVMPLQACTELQVILQSIWDAAL